MQVGITEVLGYIRVPVLALQGDRDQYGSWAQINAIEERCYAPVETVAIEDCQHSPFIDQPERTIDSISDFCARLAHHENMALEPV